MKTLEQPKVGIYNKLGWFFIAALTVAAFFVTYAVALSAPILVMAWIGWLVMALAAAFFTTAGRQAFEFSKEAKVELQKVVWPARQETVQMTSIVMLMVAITGFVLWGIDSGMMWVIAKITRLG